MIVVHCVYGVCVYQISYIKRQLIELVLLMPLLGKKNKYTKKNQVMLALKSSREKNYAYNLREFIFHFSFSEWWWLQWKSSKWQNYYLTFSSIITWKMAKHILKVKFWQFCFNDWHIIWQNLVFSNWYCTNYVYSFKSSLVHLLAFFRQKFWIWHSNWNDFSKVIIFLSFVPIRIHTHVRCIHLRTFTQKHTVLKLPIQ